MNTLPVDRALSTLADRTAIKGTRERLSKHLMKIYLEGEKDTHRLTVHGLSYLRDLDRVTDSRNEMSCQLASNGGLGRAELFRAVFAASYGERFSLSPLRPVPLAFIRGRRFSTLVSSSGISG